MSVDRMGNIIETDCDVNDIYVGFANYAVGESLHTLAPLVPATRQLEVLQIEIGSAFYLTTRGFGNLPEPGTVLFLFSTTDPLGPTVTVGRMSSGMAIFRARWVLPVGETPQGGLFPNFPLADAAGDEFMTVTVRGRLLPLSNLQAEVGP